MDTNCDLGLGSWGSMAEPASQVSSIARPAQGHLSQCGVLGPQIQREAHPSYCFLRLGLSCHMRVCAVPSPVLPTEGSGTHAVVSIGHRLA